MNKLLLYLVISMNLWAARSGNEPSLEAVDGVIVLAVGNSAQALFIIFEFWAFV